jgi:hypothetical protein
MPLSLETVFARVRVVAGDRAHRLEQPIGTEHLWERSRDRWLGDEQRTGNGLRIGDAPEDPASHPAFGRFHLRIVFLQEIRHRVNLVAVRCGDGPCDRRGADIRGFGARGDLSPPKIDSVRRRARVTDGAAIRGDVDFESTGPRCRGELDYTPKLTIPQGDDLRRDAR